MPKRVVITGMGVVSPVGNDVKTFWESLVNGKCGIDYITEFPTDGFPVKIGGMIRGLDAEAYGLEKAFIRKQDPFTVYANVAAAQAMKESGLASGENIDPFRLGTYIGSGTGGFHTIMREAEHYFEDRSGRWVSPYFVPMMIGDMAGGQVAIRLKANGPCLDIVSACATSTHSIGEAFRAISYGAADAIIAGGAEASTIPMGLAGFANARALSRKEDPKHACLPFNLNRDGFVMSDGAAVVILEEYGHAKARGAGILAEIVGYGNTCDAFHATAPSPDSLPQARCIKAAIEEAGFDIGNDSVYINAHGTGTQMNDKVETAAYKLAFGEFAYDCHISSTKSMHGHMLGASGAAEAIATILALRSGTIPPTINLDTPDPECDLDYTPNKAKETKLTLGLSSSFGFGGHNGCLAFRIPEDL